MNLKFGWRSTAALLSSLALTIGLVGCGSSDQSNPPLVKPESVVELVSSSLQYDAAGTTISGTITTKYADTLISEATLSGFSSIIEGCSVANTLVGTSDVVTYNDDNDTLSNITIVLDTACTTTSVTLSATEADDANMTSAWSESVSISLAPANAVESPIVTIVPDEATQNIVLTQNNEPHQIVLKVFDIDNVPLSNGEISVRYPSEVINGIDVGTLSPVDKVTIENGEARFTYVGPSDLTSEIASGRTGTVFTFFDTLNPTKSVDVVITYNPDTTTPPPVLTGYTVEFVSSNQQATTNLETTSVFTLSVKDDKGNLIPNDDLNSSDIISLQPNLVKFIDATGAEVSSLHFDAKNNIAMTIKTYTTSGLAPFGFVLKIKDANGVLGDKNVTKSITVFSGPPTAMSISYAGTDQDAANAKFIEKMVVSLTDKWNNPVNTEPTIYAGAITGYTVDSTSITGNQYLIRQSAVAAIDSDGADGATMIDSSGADLSQVDPYNDILMTFGNGYTYQASGKWDISSAAGSTVTMTDKYTSLNPTIDMGFAVGHNHRQDVCEFGREWIGQIDSADGTYKIDKSGSAIVDFRYDYILTGKTIVFGASSIGTLNSTGEELRMGEAIRHTLRGHGYDGTVSCSIPAGYSGECGVTVHLTDTGYSARNVNFDYTITGGEDLTINAVTTSMLTGLYTCENSGRSYVTLDVTNGTADSATIGITIRPNHIISEF